MTYRPCISDIAYSARLLGDVTWGRAVPPCRLSVLANVVFLASPPDTAGAHVATNHVTHIMVINLTARILIITLMLTGYKTGMHALYSIVQ